MDGLPAHTAESLQVFLNVYDVQQQQQGEGRGTVGRINDVLGPRGLGLGGVFHGAVVLGTVEFSFGWCERGTGVYAVKAGCNPMYTYREAVPLGPTPLSLREIRAIMQQLKADWPGCSYDLLTRNCCHFCDHMAERLQVAPVPGWLNRFAAGAAATASMAQDAVNTVHELGAEVGRLWQRTLAAASQQQQIIAGRLQLGGQQQPPGQGPGVSRGSSASGSFAASAGQQVLSGLSAVGQSLRAGGSRLATAAASRVPSSGPAGSGTAGSQQAAPGVLADTRHALGGLAAQPKLSKEYRIGSGHEGGGGSSQQQQQRQQRLAGGLPLDELDAFAALIGDDAAEDDERQRAAVASAVQQHHPAQQAHHTAAGAHQ